MAKKIALCVGINDYPGTDSDLSGCVNDANDWAKQLQSRGFTVQKLTDKQATRKAMMESLKAIIGSAQTGDSIIFSYSGHGTYTIDKDGDESDGTDECLCPYDINKNGPLTDDELFKIYSAKAPDVKLVIFSDSCHSGTVAKYAPISAPPPVKGKRKMIRKVKFMPPGAFLSKSQVEKIGVIKGMKKGSPPGRYGGLLLSGCQDTELSFDTWFNGRANGVFTYTALDVLKKLPQTATYEQWYNGIKKALPSQQHPQSPNLYGSSDMKKWKIFS